MVICVFFFFDFFFFFNDTATTEIYTLSLHDALPISMKVWQGKNKNLKSELLQSPEIMKLLTKEEIEEIFDSNKMLKNVDFIFARSVEAN